MTDYTGLNEDEDYFLWELSDDQESNDTQQAESESQASESADGDAGDEYDKGESSEEAGEPVDLDDTLLFGEGDWDETDDELVEDWELPFGSVEVRDDKRVVQHFYTVGQFYDLVFSPMAKGKHNMGMRAEQHGVNMQQSRELAERGWREGVEYVEKFSDTLRNLIAGEIVDPEMRYDLTGLQLDVGRMLEGDPECFLEEYHGDKLVEDTPPKFINIVCTIDITSAEANMARGAAVVALTQLLERQGVRVKLDAHCGSNGYIDTWVHLKDYDEAVNMEPLVFVLAHPIVFRGYVLSAWAHLEESKSHTSWRGLGETSMGWISEPLAGERGDVYVSALGSRWMSDEKRTLAWLREELKKQGVELVESEVSVG